VPLRVYTVLVAATRTQENCGQPDSGKGSKLNLLQSPFLKLERDHFVPTLLQSLLQRMFTVFRRCAPGDRAGRACFEFSLPADLRVLLCCNLSKLAETSNSERFAPASLHSRICWGCGACKAVR
jgi:hypothetical protein